MSVPPNKVRLTASATGPAVLLRTLRSIAHIAWWLDYQTAPSRLTKEVSRGDRH